MAKIVISRSFEALALSKPSANRKARRGKKRTPNVKRKNPTTRLTRSQFLDLSKPQQKKYLERFPKSKHRRLLNEEKPKKKQGKPKSKGPVKQKDQKKATKRKQTERKTAPKQEKFTKKISRDQFDQLSEKDQKAYKKKYPKDSFRGKKHFAVKKQNAVQKNKTGKDGETVMDGSTGLKEVRNRRKLENKAIKQGRDEARRDIRHGVTREAVKSLQETTPEDMKQASKNLAANRSANLKTIQDTLSSKDLHVTFKKSDISRAKDAVEKEKTNELSTWSQEDLKRADKLVNSLKEDDTNKLDKKDRDTLDRLTDDDEDYPTKKKPFWKKDLEVLKGFMTGEELDPDGRSNAMLMLSVVTRYALLGAGVAMLAAGAAPAALHISQSLFSQWGEFNSLSSVDDEEETRDDIGSVYDAVTDHLANMDHEEMMEDVQKVFKEFSSESSVSSDIMSDMLNMLLKIQCTVTSKSSTHIMARRKSRNKDRLIDGFQRVAADHDYKKESVLAEPNGAFDVRYVGKGMMLFLTGNKNEKNFFIGHQPINMSEFDPSKLRL